MKIIQCIALNILLGSVAHPVVIHVAHYKAKNGIKLPELVVLGDKHLDTADGSNGDKQLKLAIKAAKKSDAYVIVESSYDYQGDDQEIKQVVESCISNTIQKKAETLQELQDAYKELSEEGESEGDEFGLPSTTAAITINKIRKQVESSSSFLGWIVPHCNTENIAVKNIEFRHASCMAAIAPAISVSKVVTGLQNTKDQCAETLQKLSQSLSDLETKVLSEHAQEAFGTLLGSVSNEDAKTFALMSKDTTSFSELTESNKDFTDKIDECANVMLNHKILLEILANKDKKMIFVAAGAAHTADIKPRLSKLGYECMHEQGDDQNDDENIDGMVDLQKFFASFTAQKNVSSQTESKEKSEQRANRDKRKSPTPDKPDVSSSSSSKEEAQGPKSKKQKLGNTD